MKGDAAQTKRIFSLHRHRHPTKKDATTIFAFGHGSVWSAIAKCDCLRLRGAGRINIWSGLTLVSTLNEVSVH